MERLIRFFQVRLRQTNTTWLRYLHQVIDWNERAISIIGPRGVGKTTLLLQHIKMNLPGEDTLYLSLDDPYFLTHSLVDLTEDFVNLGGSYLFLDEVHKYKHWSAEIKTIIDTFGSLNIIFTGSSMLEILKADADLSRRVRKYELTGLSFREYLAVKNGTVFNPVSLTEILEQHTVIARDVTRKVKILKAFKEYLQNGYYPFFLEDGAGYHIKLTDTVNQVLETDLPLVENLQAESLRKIKTFLSLLGEMVPFQPNISALSQKLNIPRPLIYRFLDYLQRARIISLVYKKAKGLKKLEKPDKIYLDNTNLMYSLARDLPDTRSMRETFFVNQLKNQYQITFGGTHDFTVGQTIHFEIGGKNKSFQSTHPEKPVYIAADDIETGFQNKIPLWLFGFLY